MDSSASRGLYWHLIYYCQQVRTVGGWWNMHHQSWHGRSAGFFRRQKIPTNWLRGTQQSKRQPGIPKYVWWLSGRVRPSSPPPPNTTPATSQRMTVVSRLCPIVCTARPESHSCKPVEFYDYWETIQLTASLKQPFVFQLSVTCYRLTNSIMAK